jgi:hypothetical protein
MPDTGDELKQILRRITQHTLLPRRIGPEPPDITVTETTPTHFLRQAITGVQHIDLSVRHRSIKSTEQHHELLPAIIAHIHQDRRITIPLQKTPEHGLRRGDFNFIAGHDSSLISEEILLWVFPYYQHSIKMLIAEKNRRFFEIVKETTIRDGSKKLYHKTKLKSISTSSFFLHHQ